MNPTDHLLTDCVEHCAQALAAAHHARRAIAGGENFIGLTREEALQVQARVMELLGQSTQVSKVGINGQGQGICAPIFARDCGTSRHTFTLPSTGFLGIEVEIAARLSRDVTPALAAEGPEVLLAAIESFHIGVELVATRLTDRDAAGSLAQLADSISTFGYVHSERPFAPEHDISGLDVEVEIDGIQLDRVPASSAFGNILNPILSCGLMVDRPVDCLKAGTLVSTGALSGLIPIQKPALIRAGLTGFEPVTLTLA